MREGLKISDALTDNNLPLVLFSSIYYAIIIFLAGYLNVWEDEVYSLNTSSGSLQYAFHQSIFFEAQPPVYFLLLTLWRFFSDSILWARLLNLLLILVSQFLLFRFVGKTSDKKIATISSILFLLNPAIVFTLLEIRLFAFVILISLVIIIIFYNTYYSNKITLGFRILYILFAVIGLFTQFFIGFLLFANAVVLIIDKKKRLFWLYILDMLIPFCLIILFIPQVLQDVKVHTSVIPVYYRTLNDFIFEIKELIGIVTFNYFLPFKYFIPKIWEWIFRVTVIILIFTSLKYVERKKGLRYISPFIVISLVIFLFFIIVTYTYGKYSIEYKYTLVIFVPLFISMVLLFRLFKKGSLIFWLFFLGLIYLAGNFTKYHYLYKVKDYKSLGNYLEEHENMGEPIFVFRNISAENLDIYYHGVNNIYPLPEAFSYDKEFSSKQWEINKQDVSNLCEKLTKYSEFYIVIDDTALSGFNESKNTLMDFLFTEFNMMEEKLFNGRLTLYKFSDSTK